MNRFLLLMGIICVASSLSAQTFEVIGLQESYRGIIGETIRVPLHFKNNTDKPINLIIKRVSEQIGTTQKNYFCIDDNCLDQRTEDFVIKVEPYQVINSFNVVLDAGLAQGISSLKYLIINRSAPSDALEVDLNFLVEEKTEKEHIYSSNHLILHDLFPNPATEHAFADYRILNQEIKAKIVIHNILGNIIEEYDLPFADNRVKIRAESMNAGIYFYTLYVDNKGVITRKLIIKK